MPPKRNQLITEFFTAKAQKTDADATAPSIVRVNAGAQSPDETDINDHTVIPWDDAAAFRSLNISATPRIIKAAKVLRTRAQNNVQELTDEDGLIKMLKLLIKVGNSLVENGEENQRKHGTQAFRNDPNLANKVAHNMPLNVREAFRRGDIYDGRKVCELDGIDARDGSAGVYLIIVDRGDGTFGYYIGMAGALKRDGSPAKSFMWKRYARHRALVASGYQEHLPLYADLRSGASGKFIPLIRWDNLNKWNLEFLETLMMIGFDSVKERDGIEDLMGQHGLLRSDSGIVRYNAFYSSHPVTEFARSSKADINQPPPTWMFSEECRAMSALTRKRGTMLLQNMGGTDRTVVHSKPSKTRRRGRAFFIVYAHEEVCVNLPTDWWFPTPPRTVQLTLYIDNEEKKKEPLWHSGACRVKIGVSFGGRERFIKMNSPKMKAAVSHWCTFWDRDLKNYIEGGKF
ncbi:hypothetical protein HK104_008948 [Borealophlyctis nickersoniae]|nr:hypothetical protein HK104_008948 [Borealophlyctis nickersoniae]